MKHKKTCYTVTLMVLLIISAVINNPYREFIYRYGIHDMGVADAGNNIFVISIILTISWLGLFKITGNKVLDVCVVTSVYVILEIISYFFPYIGTFDSKDLLGLLLGMLFALFLVLCTEKESFSVFYKKILNGR